MRWKMVALAGALGPTAAGCNIAYYTAQTLVNEPCVVATQLSIHHSLRKQANASWKEVRGEYPRRAFTSEFHDGFVDGYVDYLEHGGNGSIPAAPPPKYTRHKHYLTEEGQCLVKDYFLGFKYGQDIAIASGKRQFLTVPVLLPVEDKGPPAFKIQPPAGSEILSAPKSMSAPTPPPAPTPVPQQSQSQPAPTQLQFPTLTPEQIGAGGSLPQSGSVAIPPLPAESTPARIGIPPAPPPAVAPKLPAPPPEVAQFPAYVPTPPVSDEIPTVPPNRTELPVALPTHPEAAGKQP
ncbi:MAG: hypothetical protein C0467_17240 [Planctomycetaceae bacterium]|nr:hypothetical protein [Planctomycetaceae bacterium]